jgi:DNA-binding NarL/FixJ family response regulator
MECFLVSQSGRIRVLVAASSSIFALGLMEYLRQEATFDCVGMTTSGPTALAMVTSLAPDVVVVDAYLTDTHVPTLCQQIRECPSPPKILAMGDSAVGIVPITLVRAGIDGYVCRGCDVPELFRAIHLLSEGVTSFPPGLTDAVVRKMQAISRLTNQAGSHAVLTERELHVLEEVARGASNRDIAQHLRLSKRTIETHLHNIFRKFGVHRRTEALAVGLRRGYLANLTLARSAGSKLVGRDDPTPIRGDGRLVSIAGPIRRVTARRGTGSGEPR